MKRALVIQPAFIGDAVCSLALASCLKGCDRELELTYLVRPESAGLLRYAPHVQDVVAFDKYGVEKGRGGIASKAKELNSLGFDSVFCLHGSRRSLELVRLLDAPVKVGSSRSSVFTHFVPSQPGDDASMAAARLATAIYPECDTQAVAKLSFPETLIPSELSSLPRPLIGVAPGSVWTTKRWPAVHFSELIAKLCGRGTVVIVGQDRDIDPELMEAIKTNNNNTISYVSKLSLERSAAVIGALDVLVSNDSAPVHIAIATGVPVVDIMGPTLREFGFAPRPGSGTVIEVRDLWCRPCSSHGAHECPTHTFECMRGITVDPVLAATEMYLRT